MSWIGDFAAESTFDTKFCTVSTTGVPTVLAGTPVISAYEDNGLVQITAGITLSVDFDTVVGLNNIRVVATAANGFDAGSNYQLVITTGTVGGTSVVGYVVAEFSIAARSALRPTTAGRTLDVSATGEAGLDWANIGAPTTAQNLSATNIDVDQVVASVTGAVGSVTGAVGSVTGAVGSVTADVGITQAGADKVWSSATRTLTAFSTALALSVWDVLETAILTASSIGLKLKNNLDVVLSTRATPAQVNTEVVDALNVDTYAEPGQGTPAATNTLVNKISFLYKLLRNRLTATATTISVFNDDAVTVDQKSTHSDDGTTYDRGEFTTGP